MAFSQGDLADMAVAMEGMIEHLQDIAGLPHNLADLNIFDQITEYCMQISQTLEKDDDCTNRLLGMIEAALVTEI